MKNYNAEYLTRQALEEMGVNCSGDDVRVHSSCIIINPAGISLGNYVRIDAFCILSATGFIQLADNVHIGCHSSLMGAGGIVMQRFSGVSHGVRVFSAVDDLSGRNAAGPTVPDAFRRVHSAKVELESHAAVGANSVLLPGVTLHEGAILGANSFARKSLPGWTVWFGSPAKQIAKRRKDVLDLAPAVLRALGE